MTITFSLKERAISLWPQRMVLITKLLILVLILLGSWPWLWRWLCKTITPRLQILINQIMSNTGSPKKSSQQNLGGNVERFIGHFVPSRLTWNVWAILTIFGHFGPQNMLFQYSPENFVSNFFGTPFNNGSN